MIIDPDFLDHWRTRMVADALGDELAPVYIMRLWSHCQHRKSDRFEMPPAGLKAQCRCPADAVAFEQAMTDAGFVKRDGDFLMVMGWAEQNAALLAAWENGAKGGRPPKPKQNPRVPDSTSKEPEENPRVTHGQPDANPDETDKSREEKTPSLRSGEKPRKRVAVPRPDDVGEQTWADWLELRAKKRAPVTETVVAGARDEAAKAELTLERFLAIWCTRGSQGLQAAWLKPEERGARTAGPAEPEWRTEQRRRTQQAAPGVAAGQPGDFFDVEARNVTTPAIG